MNPDPLKEAWQMQSSPMSLTPDANRLFEELRSRQKAFVGTIFWRDVREVGVSLLMIPVWIYLGMKQQLPWTWYLTVPALVWIAGFMLLDRLRHRRQAAESGKPLRQHVEHSLAQVEHQIWLLRNVHWWYLLPLFLAILAFIGLVAWNMGAVGWWAVLGAAISAAIMVAMITLVFVGVYRLNQSAVRSSLEPRRRELEGLLASLGDEPQGEKVEGRK